MAPGWSAGGSHMFRYTWVSLKIGTWGVLKYVNSKTDGSAFGPAFLQPIEDNFTSHMWKSMRPQEILALSLSDKVKRPAMPQNPMVHTNFPYNFHGKPFGQTHGWVSLRMPAELLVSEIGHSLRFKAEWSGNISVALMGGLLGQQNKLYIDVIGI